jgi:hypothetical protein
MDLLIGAMNGWLELALAIRFPIKDGHFRLVQLFHLTIVKEMKIDTSFSHLPITL